MATEVIRKLICDVGERHDATSTVTFAFSGDTYEIDLCDKHAKQMEKDLSTWVGAGRRGARAAVKATRHRVSKPRAEGATDTELARNWAKLIGVEVPETGRLKAAVIQQWKDAGSPGREAA